MLFLYAMKLKKMIEKGLITFHISFDDKKVDELLLYLLELEKWNKRMNLVGLKDMDSIVKELLFDAFFIHGYVRGSRNLMDFGSGSGIIAIPLAILTPEIEIFSVDKSLKKIQFQRHIKRILHLRGFTPVHGRFEALEPLGVESITVKGFGNIQEILDKGKKHLTGKGTIFILKGKRASSIEHEGFSMEAEIPYTLPMNDKAYRLFIYKKR
jgi:16S rRNA (guanine527-N7)-methyltransferase